jgi:hypothetical protein
MPNPARLTPATDYIEAEFKGQSNESTERAPESRSGAFPFPIFFRHHGTSKTPSSNARRFFVLDYVGASGWVDLAPLGLTDGGQMFIIVSDCLVQDSVAALSQIGGRNSLCCARARCAPRKGRRDSNSGPQRWVSGLGVRIGCQDWASHNTQATAPTFAADFCSTQRVKSHKSLTFDASKRAVPGKYRISVSQKSPTFATFRRSAAG